MTIEEIKRVLRHDESASTAYVEAILALCDHVAALESAAASENQGTVPSTTSAGPLIVNCVAEDVGGGQHIPCRTKPLINWKKGFFNECLVAANILHFVDIHATAHEDGSLSIRPVTTPPAQNTPSPGKEGDEDGVSRRFQR